MSQQLQRGDIVLIPFPFTNLSGSKRRPAVILAEYSPDIIVGFISSVVPPLPEPTDVLLQPVAPTGLKKLSVLRLRKLATLEQTLVTRRLGRLDNHLLAAVDWALLSGLRIDITSIIQVEYRKLAAILQNEGDRAVLTHIQSQL